ncbi:MAG: response regulator, partial [Deltaproteobacteria bacterium]|nr:response regulator [Deltaproteobacteria bacterium]
KWNHSVLTALSGQEGVEIFKAHRVDAVVCDLAMPGMNGRQVAETLRDYCKKLALPKPPFIILTGWAELPEDELHMTQSGVDAVIAKPADLAKLLGIIAGLTQAEQIQSQDRT